ncbi:hypothetical protein DOM22_19620 [Bdellovibrio sp. ZAP7]|uniref:hypothetical protein n=1 Tax=Bdellovibrio sp. ZAP7 TaxID=2231053 RepID=UPI00115A1732|nr:hypothetical protein [Bdellovibrio sp. ZAP7]QDK47217.1 hypothetical protein DOM22_19620 [Bdellovibrio sp. ZAP7]
MKKLFVMALLLASSTAHAGAIKEVAIMAMDDVEETLNLLNPDFRYVVKGQGFAEADDSTGTAIQTVVEIRNLITFQVREWNCTTQFHKTPEFFEITYTVCK